LKSSATNHRLPSTSHLLPQAVSLPSNKIYAGMTPSQIETQQKCTQALSHADLKEPPTESFLFLDARDFDQTLESNLNRSDWSAVFKQIDQETQPKAQKALIEDFLDHPKFSVALKALNQKEARAPGLNQLMYLLLHYHDRKITERFVGQLKDHPVICQKIIAYEAKKPIRERLGIELLCQNKCVLNDQNLLDQLMVLEDARLLIAKSNIDSQAFWDKFIATLCFPKNSQYCTRHIDTGQLIPNSDGRTYDLTLSQVEKNTLATALANNSAITSPAPLLLLLKTYFNATDKTNNFLNNTNLSVYRGIATTPRDWELPHVSAFTGQLSKKITSWLNSSSGPKFGSPEYFNFVEGFIENEGLASVTDISDLLKRIQKGSWRLNAVARFEEKVASLNIKMTADQALDLYRLLPKRPAVLKAVAGNLAFPNVIIADAVRSYSQTLKSPQARLAKAASNITDQLK